MAGTWSQGGSSFPLSLIRSAGIKPPKRPQEPEPPLPYIEEEITIKNEQDDLTLSGTFTYPENIDNLPVVILISGSGPQNRNEELLGHKPFLVLADHLTRNGIAVLRFDDRGIGQSTGDFSSATTEDFVTDVLAAVDYLETRKEIDQDKIGLIGHSEGGLVAPIASVKCDEIDFIILMAAPGLSGREILRLQTALIMRAGGADEELISREVESAMKSYDIIINEQDSAAAREKLKKYFDESYAGMSKEEKEQLGNPDSYFDQQARMLLSPWFKYFLEYDPYPVLTEVKIPVLAINGEKDLQVPPKENLSLIEKAFNEGGNKNYKIVELPGLNHLFQVAETGSPDEYVKIEQTISPDALNLITEWINQNVE
ncbi:MAG: alpha/beta hydrolase [Ignavibacteriales bacterium]|nr:MAG: alpha/beta hydrolase [Ignavibacteriales bacterium]